MVDKQYTRLTLEQAHDLCLDVLRHFGMSDEHAQAMSQNLLACQRDECHSHGLHRLLLCAQTLKQDPRSGQAVPQWLPSASNAIVRIDANYGFSPLAFRQGTDELLQRIQQTGLAALVIRNCYHATALWPEVEYLAENGLAALAMVPAHAWVAPAGGRVPVFGTNPIAFAWPRPGPYPYVFDFATSAVARGELELCRREGVPLAEGWGVDRHGQASTDPQEVLDYGAMLTFGGHKGSALATMVELLAGSLLGDLTSLQSLAVDQGQGGTPLHGELIIAMDPKAFAMDDVLDGQNSAEALFKAITQQENARLPSERRFIARQTTQRTGTVNISTRLYHELTTMRSAPTL